MDKRTPREIAEAISKLSIWEERPEFNWGLVPQTTEFPYIGQLAYEKEGPLKGRLLLFPGFQVFHDFLMSRRFSDYGVFTSLLDFPHYTILFPRKGAAQCARYTPGFHPKDINSEEDDPLFKALASQTYGVLLRLESDSKFAGLYSKEKAIVARKEISDNNWIDGPLRVPAKIPIKEERIVFKKSDCEKAAALKKNHEIWEVEFAMFPNFRTMESPPRFLYVFAGVDSKSGEKRFCYKMSVDGTPDGLLKLWEKHAERLLESILKFGEMPEEIRVRSPRVMRFIRPLGMYLPFKLSQYKTLPSIETYFNEVISKGGE
jgi:hypothetical protein